MEKNWNHHGKATIYRNTHFGYHKLEVKDVATDVGPYAQYNHAILVKYLEPRKRNWSGFVETFEPGLVILEGHGHFAPADAFDLEDVSGGNGVTIRKTRYSSCDPRWRTEFDALLAEHVEKTGAKILFDGRGWNAHRGEYVLPTGV